MADMNRGRGGGRHGRDGRGGGRHDRGGHGGGRHVIDHRPSVELEKSSLTLGLTPARRIADTELYKGNLMIDQNTFIEVTHHAFTSDNQNMMDWYNLGLRNTDSSLLRIYGRACWKDNPQHCMIVTEDSGDTLDQWLQKGDILANTVRMTRFKRIMRQVLRVLHMFRTKLDRDHGGVGEHSIFIKHGDVVKVAYTKVNAPISDVEGFRQMLVRIFTRDNVDCMPPELRFMYEGMEYYCLSARATDEGKTRYLKHAANHPALLDANDRSRYTRVARSAIFEKQQIRYRATCAVDEALARVGLDRTDWRNNIQANPQYWEYWGVLTFNSSTPNDPVYFHSGLEFLRYSDNCGKHITRVGPQDMDRVLSGIYPRYLEVLHEALCMANLTFHLETL